jgi:hypothetical protein
VPFVEQASLEEPDSPLVELWANLLVSAVENYDGHFLHFSRLIAGLSAKQAQLFKDHFTAADLHKTQLDFDEVSIYFEQSHIQRHLELRISSIGPEDDDAMADCIIESFDNSAVLVIHSSFESDSGYSDVVFPYETAKDDDDVDYSILLSLGLINRVSTDFIDFSRGSTKWSISVIYYHLTSLGNAFARACKMRPHGV